MECTSPDGILTKDEIALLVENCLTPWDKALTMTLYESGCRVGELARMEWRDLVFDWWGVRVYIHDTKGQQTRYSRLVSAAGPLLIWKNSYPGTPAGDAPVFLTRNRQRIVDVTVKGVLRRAADLAGITKRIYPHLFRKSRAMHMVADGYQESVIKASLWGNLNTEMFRIYVKMAEKEIDAEFLSRAGLVVKEESLSDALKPVVCARCHTLNGPGVDYCSKCGQGLSDEAVAEEGELDGVTTRRAKDMIDYLQRLIDSGDLPRPSEEKVMESRM
ncbi:tyrosine-type recombinase/integrase [Methanosphaerula subterraneus]|uniref:tyrosine-type recombinase/integrase n=1 Tax=Methanosphaerula subterraneus TaxID=3350244 RepID=UPI003F83A927